MPLRLVVRIQQRFLMFRRFRVLVRNRALWRRQADANTGAAPRFLGNVEARFLFAMHIRRLAQLRKQNGLAEGDRPSVSGAAGRRAASRGNVQLGKLADGRRRHGVRPVSIPKLPVAVSILRRARKESAFLHTLIRRFHLNFVVARSNNGEIGGERIYPQIISPSQRDLLDGAREILDPRRSRCAVRERHATVNGHKERRGVGKMPAPRCGAVVRDIVSYDLHESSHTVIDRSGTGWCQGLQLIGHSLACAAPNECQRCEKKAARPSAHDESFHERMSFLELDHERGQGNRRVRA
jgi:hypothetical protein